SAVGGIAGIGSEMINPGARRDQMLDRRLQLARRQSADVVEFKLAQRLVELNLPVLDVLAVENRQHALANGGQIALVCQIAVLEQRSSADRNYHRRCIQ